MKKTAVILAGGKGTRLRPYTLALPKPLVPLGNVPILEIILKQLRTNGFEKINIAVNHQADLIKAYCGNGEKYDLQIEYFLEDRPLGTIGPLKRMENYLPENFIVMNGDILSDLSYSELLLQHIKRGSEFTISCYKRIQKIDYGVLEIKDNRLIGFQEKPNLDCIVSMGVYAVRKSVLEIIPKDTYYGFDNLMKDMLIAGRTVKTCLYDGYWMDIGRPEDYEQASLDIESGMFNRNEQ